MDESVTSITEKRKDSAITASRLETSLGKDIKVDKFTLQYGSKVLLKDADLMIGFGHKYGIVGPNGCGKSSLLRHIANRHFSIPSHIRILFVEQEVIGDGTPALESVLSSDVERLKLLDEEKRLKELIDGDDSDAALQANERLVDVLSLLRAIGAYTAEARARSILTGLSFDEEMKSKPTREFSGGWRMRLALARALFLIPDLLILDEPTNHLDLNAVIWLEEYLKRWHKTLIVVSHDRDFMNYFVTDIIWIHNTNLQYFRGDYDSFERITAQTKRQAEKAEKKERLKVKKIQERQSVKDRKERKRMNLPGVEKGREKEREYSVSFEFQDPGPLLYPILQVKEAQFWWPTSDGNPPPSGPLFSHLDLNVDMNSKIAIVGPNGAGKSTLMSILLGELEPTIGQVNRNRHLRTVKFAQHFVEQLELTANAVEYLLKMFPKMTPLDIRQVLGRFGIKGSTATQPIALLSGGQKSRIMLVNIYLKNPHILFLDEPTNHLDSQSVDALTEALKDFPGGIILISHDQRLLKTVCDQLWVVRDHTCKRYEGDFDDYRQEIIESMDSSLFQ